MANNITEAQLDIIADMACVIEDTYGERHANNIRINDIYDAAYEGDAAAFDAAIELAAELAIDLDSMNPVFNPRVED